MDDDDIIDEVDLDNVVPPSPWTNNDTAAAVFFYARALATAASDFFQQMHVLATGQAALEWKQMDKAEFVQDADALIRRLAEDGDGDG